MRLKRISGSSDSSCLAGTSGGNTVFENVNEFWDLLAFENRILGWVGFWGETFVEISLRALLRGVGRAFSSKELVRWRGVLKADL